MGAREPDPKLLAIETEFILRNNKINKHPELLKYAGHPTAWHQSRPTTAVVQALFRTANSPDATHQRRTQQFVDLWSANRPPVVVYSGNEGVVRRSVAYKPSSLQTFKNKQSSSCNLQTFGPPLLLQRIADVVRRLQMF
ncbi:hypothetical protein LXL04_012616 [Taraxacum kok-saghyz]